MFRAKISKIMFTPVNSKVGGNRSTVYGHVSMMKILFIVFITVVNIASERKNQPGAKKRLASASVSAISQYTRYVQ